MNRVIKNKKLSGEISGITSKSYAHRTIFCAAIARGNSIIEISDLSKDIEASINVIKSLGVEVIKKENKFYINPPKTYKNQVTLDVNESGTTLRFLLPIVATLGIDAKIIRRGSLINRTNSVYFHEFPKHGVDIYEKDDAIFVRGKLKDYNFTLPANISSQFVSGFMIASGFYGEDFKIKITTEMESKPYIDMTIDIMEKFGSCVIEGEREYICRGKFKAIDYVVEKDWSNALFFLASGVKVKGLDKNSKQGDRRAIEIFRALGYENISKEDFQFKRAKAPEKKIIIDSKNMPDAVPILSVLAAASNTETEVVNIKRLKLKESDRVKSTVEMLNNLGVDVKLKENSFTFRGIEKFKGVKIDSHKDHRIAMTASIAATFAEGPITINNSDCVEKSYKNFFKDFKSLGGISYVL